MTEAAKETVTITKRWSWLPSVDVEIECDPALPPKIKLGLAVKVAFEKKIVLTGAVLRGADLTGAVLRGAVLRSADLTGADLTGADLTGADLTGAVLTGADLKSAVLRGAVLRSADGSKITVQRAPLQITGLYWPVTIWDAHMQIGCEFHSLAEWEAFDDRRIIQMDGRDAAKFWMAHKDALLTLARRDGRSFEPVSAAADPQAVEAGQ